MPARHHRSVADRGWRALGRCAATAVLIGAAAAGPGAPALARSGPDGSAGPARGSSQRPLEELRRIAAAPIHDDLDGLLRRGTIRVAVTYSKTHFFIDRGQQHGFAFEALREFEAFLRQRHRRPKGGRPLTITYMPVPRDELLVRLRDGRADLAVANLTVTPEREALADFTAPLLAGVREILVTRDGVPTPTTLDDLSGREVVVRPSSSFHEHLLALNARFAAAGRDPVRIVAADEHLETEDLLEMLDAGLIDATIADEHIASLWTTIFPRLRTHPEIAVAEGGRIAWAVRKGAPALLAEADAFLAGHRPGTAFGNVLRQRYLESPYWAKRALGEGELKRFGALVELFRTYGERYGFDHLMLLAQGFQESGLDHDRRSPVGAIGVMQLMPQTGASMRVGDITLIEPNVHAGTKYLRSIIDRDFSDPAIGPADRVLFGFAAYNAGPARIRALRQKAAAQGLDPNVWFGHVETVAARTIGQETVQYVANISKYYLAYRMIENRRREREAARQAG